MLPNFRQKFLTKDLIVRTPVKNSERKQKIIILVDASGSMDENEKQQWVSAILVDRFRYVCKGEAEIFISSFVAYPDELYFRHIRNEEDVADFWKHYNHGPNGGGTDMGRIVDYISNQIDKGKLCNLKIDLREERPEILIINDGQDSVGREKFNYKVNALSLMMRSKKLTKLCNASGGKQIYVERSGTVLSFVDGKETQI